MTDFQDSTDNAITYHKIKARALNNANARIPALPKANTLDAWENFIDELDALDAYEIASESGDWDWVIHYSRAMELCMCVPNDVLDDAESDWHDIGFKDNLNDSFGLFEIACQLAGLIVTREIVEVVEQVRDELLELANNQIENEGW